MTFLMFNVFNLMLGKMARVKDKVTLAQ